MKEISVKDLVEFRKKSDRAKKTFVENIKSNKIEPPLDGGGDYWIASLSAICNSFKQGDLYSVDEKIQEIQEKLANTRHNITKDMYQRNIAILHKYKSMDVKSLYPTGKLSFLKKSTGNPLVAIKGLLIKAKPSHIYTFGKKEEEKIGAIWFTAKVKGYHIEEIAMICDLLYKFLKQNYSKKYQLASKYCMAIDMVSGQSVDYSEIENGKLSKVLSLTLDEINKLI